MTIDQSKLDALLGRAVVDIGASFHAALVVTGDQLGLFRALRDVGPVTSANLAKHTNTHERYVREWLAAMAAGGYITYDGPTREFSLSAEQAVALTTRYVKERKAFGKPLFDQQNTRFKLAECRAQAHVGRVFLDSCIARFIARSLDEASTAIAKYWLTETQCRIIDECVQLHGGYGYMSEFPIARMWADSRVQRIYAGSNEIMKELIAWSL